MNKPIKIYTDPIPLTDINLKDLSPILSYHWAGRSATEILSGEFSLSSNFEIVNQPNDADFFVLLMHWSYYLWNGKAKMREAIELAELASQFNKRVVVWFKGDLVPKIPFENNILLLPGIIRSRMKPNYVACPVFVDDPSPTFGNEKTQYRQKSAKPTVGFCGYGTINAVKLGWSIVACLRLSALSRFNRYDFDEIPIVPAAVVRDRAMKLLERNPAINTRFVSRTKHTANSARVGVEESTRVFFENIYETDYTLCVRGFGNWSYRFYETLACGRIPVFVDSDCVLPLDSRIDWKKYCVWVDQSEVHLIGEKILEFHSTLSPTDFVDLQSECRKLWQEQLSPQGCMENIHFYLKERE
jgi:hypothetical protein